MLRWSLGCLAVLVTAVTLTGAVSGRPEPKPPAATVPHHAGVASEPARPEGAHRRGPLVVVGVDGMTFDVLDPMVARGELPHLAELMSQGARAVLESEHPMRSPALWTTIATGQPRNRHRIFDFVTGSAYWPRAERNVPQRLVTSDMRREPALWNLVGPQVRSLVVGWLNTWPAETLPGTMVAPYVALGQLRQTSIKGKIYSHQAGQVYPRELTPHITPLILDAEDVTSEAVAELVDVPPPGSALYRAIPQLDRYLFTVRWSIASTLTNTNIVESQLRTDNYDLVMTYFDG